MKEIMINLSRRLSLILKEKSNVIIILLELNLWFILYVYVEILDAQYHYYMNNKISLEQIHNVTIDNYNGQLEKRLSTEEELIRKTTENFIYIILLSCGIFETIGNGVQITASSLISYAIVTAPAEIIEPGNA